VIFLGIPKADNWKEGMGYGEFQLLAMLGAGWLQIFALPDQSCCLLWWRDFGNPRSYLNYRGLVLFEATYAPALRSLSGDCRVEISSIDPVDDTFNFREAHWAHYLQFARF